MTERAISMVSECVSRYTVKKNLDGSATITIEVPKRFRDLWMTRLSEMETTLTEIDSYRSEGNKD